MDVIKYTDGLYSVDTELNFNQIKESCHKLYNIIKIHFQNNGDYTGQANLDTRLYTKYNLLLYPFAGIHELYFSISQIFHECKIKENNGLNEKYVIQAWLNFYNKGDYIDWHQHTAVDFNCWHGFLCVDTEPGSFTSYRWPNNFDKKEIIDVPSKNGRIVMGRSNGDIHRSSEWSYEDRPRITIAFDIVPTRFVNGYCLKDYNEPRYSNAMKNDPMFINHWIPI